MRRSILRALLKEEVIKSLAEGRRLVENGALSINGNKMTDASLMLEPGTYTIQVGKTRIITHVVPEGNGGYNGEQL